MDTPYTNVKNSFALKRSTRYHGYYLDRFISMKCSIDMLQNDLFPNAKEITESFGAFEATKYLVSNTDGLTYGNPNISVVVVGDGHTPKTAATFAYRTAWQCYSIDPVLRPKSYNIKRLTLLPNKVEDCSLNFEDQVLIVAVHNHAPISSCLKSISGKRRSLISMPCCVPDNIQNPDISYEDQHIHSPKNRINIWRQI